MQDDLFIPNPETPKEETPIIKKRGRPKGSKNKPKVIVPAVKEEQKVEITSVIPSEPIIEAPKVETETNELTPFINKIHLETPGNCEVLKQLPDNSIDAVVTDPPYELGFMGKAWDKSGIAYKVEMWKEVFRVLKPGGHLLSFGGSRTYHRMACAIEDAGFEIRDQIMWVYGSGFPKSLNIGKAVDKLQGNKREVVGEDRSGSKRNCMAGDFTGGKYDLTKGTSEWEGWGTALKPAHEPIVLARKPLSEKTVAENCLRWGVGGLNIDGCRVEGKLGGDPNRFSKTDGGWAVAEFHEPPVVRSEGRFPANFIHDGSQEVLDLFPQSNGCQPHKINSKKDKYAGWGSITNKNGEMIGYEGKGSAARFFYCAKANKKERNMGCEGLETKESVYPGANTFDENGNRLRSDGSIIPPLKSKNNHPTVKPLALMKYLVKLVTREGQVVLDNFMGSGSTGIACKLLNRNYIGMDIEKAYIDIANARIQGAKDEE